ncbi:hypothetical protein FDP41_004910 [Naegleria fowleri]|uniref:Uncharacterized protein n=1 Tax=Naegleria fowleri TaxID=5763 RepID=A0A6A5BS39_NAEFO|nr:uncharacterized protein FDP41_004910 [Naegleria fowleri]KAF0976235.1 hypothetical protein FDP41_004910 [Naegleria fowleri]CAG4713804.1 unnamed protein product [Naegleria fowleri]
MSLFNTRSSSSSNLEDSLCSLLESMKRKPLEPSFHENEEEFKEGFSSNNLSSSSKYFSYTSSLTVSTTSITCSSSSSSFDTFNVENSVLTPTFERLFENTVVEQQHSPTIFSSWDEDHHIFNDIPEISVETLERVSCGCDVCSRSSSSSMTHSTQSLPESDVWQPLTRNSLAWRASCHLHQHNPLNKHGAENSISSQQQTLRWNPFLPHLPGDAKTIFGESSASVDRVDSFDESTTLSSSVEQEQQTPVTAMPSTLQTPLIGSKEEFEGETFVHESSSRQEPLISFSKSTQKNSKIMKPKKMLRALEIPMKSIPLGVRK